MGNYKQSLRYNPDNQVPILLVRHGYSPANHAGWGKQDVSDFIKSDRDCMLDFQYGVKQVEETANYIYMYIEEMGKKLRRKPKILFLVSPYRRTQETADIIIKKAQGLAKDKKVNVEALRERSQGLTFARPKELSCYDFLLEDIQQLQQKSKTTKVPEYIGNQETVKEVRHRLRNFVLKLKKLAKLTKDYDSIIIVAHNDVNRQIYQEFNGVNNGKNYNPNTGSVVLANYRENMDCRVKPVADKGIGDSQRENGMLFIPKTKVPKKYKICKEQIERIEKIRQSPNRKRRTRNKTKANDKIEMER